MQLKSEQFFSIHDRLKNGAYTGAEMDRWKQQQRENTGMVTSMKGAEEGGWQVRFPKKNLGFANLAAAIEWCSNNLGIINDENGKRLAGQTIEEIRTGQLN